MGTVKGYNNPGSWDSIENPEPKIKTIMKDNIIENDEFVDIESGEIIGKDDISENDEILDTDDIETPDIIEIPDNEQDSEENFDDVVSLTQFDDTMMNTNNSSYMVAEYVKIDTIRTSKRHQAAAKSYVDKIVKFISEFKDVELDEMQTKYLKEVGNLECQNLADMLYLVDINKQMLNNIIARVNATMAEDYSIIMSFNQLSTQHFKMVKELQNTYRSIPINIKKLKAEIVCNQELLGKGEDDELNNMANNELAYNDSKSFLRSLHDKIEARKKLKIEGLPSDKTNEEVKLQ